MNFLFSEEEKNNNKQQTKADGDKNGMSVLHWCVNSF